MSSGNQEVERVREARRILERMRGRLLRPSPASLQASAEDLELAVECLRELDVSLKSPIWHGLTRQRVETEVVALRLALRSVEQLLRNAGKFYYGLARLLAPDDAPPNYTAAGALGAVPHPRDQEVLLHG
jgi:hypothetical protein